MENGLNFINKEDIEFPHSTIENLQYISFGNGRWLNLFLSINLGWKMLALLGG